MKTLNVIFALSVLFVFAFSVSSCTKDGASELNELTTADANEDSPFLYSFSLPAEAPDWTEEQIFDYLKRVESGEILVERTYTYSTPCSECVAADLPHRLVVCINSSLCFLVLSPNSMVGCFEDHCSAVDYWTVYAMSIF